MTHNYCLIRAHNTFDLFMYTYKMNIQIHKKLVLSGLLPFSTSYLCEVDFSVLKEIKNKKKKRKIT